MKNLLRFKHLGPFLVLLLAVTGCGSNLPSVPETPPPDHGPIISAEASLRPFYGMSGKAPVAAGTGFVVQDKSGRQYMLTAAHVMDNEAEWDQVRDVALRTMPGETVARVEGRPLYLGKPFDVASAAVDLVIWPLADGAKVAPLKLAAEDPKRNQWVWVVGQEPGHTGPQKMFLCKVTGTDTGGLVLQQHNRFELRGFSGGPVVDEHGAVVGSVLGGGAPTLLVSRVSSLRQRLAEANIELP